MHDRCSPAVVRAIEAATARPGAGGPHRVAAANLLMALIEEEDGRATVLLGRHGVNRDLLWEYLAGASVILDTTVDAVLAEALTLTRDAEGEGTVTSEFFLLALIRGVPGLNRLLAEHGLDLKGLERDVLGAGPPVVTVTEPIRLSEPTERFAAGRVIDVNANRARESLRILDDYCRFVLDDVFLTGEVKRLRHDLAGLLDHLPPGLLLGARETERDVGTGIGTERESQRDSPREVARVNLKRLQESLRSLEEFGKLFGVNFAEGIEQLRYRAYTLEKAILPGEDGRRRLADVRLCVLLTGSQCVASLEWTIAEAAAGGAGVFQLREKDLDDRPLLQRARDVRKWTRQAGALFIVNDRPDIARLTEADGVHLGQEDMPVHEARQIVGPDALIGVSTHDLAQVRRAVLDGASYIGAGPTFPSSTKDFKGFAGVEFVKQATAEMSLPAFAIGGIDLKTVGAAVAAGARRVAVSAAIAKAEDPRSVARLLREALAAK